MDPFTLLALATAAGFVFNKKPVKPDKEERREFTFSKDLVVRLNPDNTSEFDINSIEILPEYRLVKSLIDHQFPIVFITGGAGTGKSTFVRWILNEFKGTVLLGAWPRISIFIQIKVFGKNKRSHIGDIASIIFMKIT